MKSTMNPRLVILDEEIRAHPVVHQIPSKLQLTRAQLRLQREAEATRRDNPRLARLLRYYSDELEEVKTNEAMSLFDAHLAVIQVLRAVNRPLLIC